MYRQTGATTGGRTIGPYTDSLPLSNQFQGGGGGGGGWGRLKGRGAPGPQHIWLKMTPHRAGHFCGMYVGKKKLQQGVGGHGRWGGTCV